MTLIDAHGHLQFKQYDADRAAVVARARAAGVVGMINVGTDIIESEKAIILAEQNSDMWATAGIHPTEPPLPTDWDGNLKRLAVLARHPRVVGIGECGLDYFRLGPDGATEKKIQRELLTAQIDLALAVGKPLMLHCRPASGALDAYEDLHQIFERDFSSQLGSISANVHFFVGDWPLAEKFLALGFSFSLGGVVTITGDYDEVAKRLPAERLLLETDCPFVAPAPWRGQRNEPAYLSAIVKRLAELREMEEVKLAEQTTANARHLFSLASLGNFC